MLREGHDQDQARETAETRRADREDVHDILQGMQDLRMARSCRLHNGARSTTTHQTAYKAIWRFSVVGDLVKSKTKEKARPSTASAFSLAFDCL